MFDFNPKKALRKEIEVMQALATLCQSPGYIHCLAELYYEDFHLPIKNNRKLDTKAFLKINSFDSLNRKELFTLAGLMVQKKMDFKHPGKSNVRSYKEKTKLLLEELHWVLHQLTQKIRESMSDPNAEDLREPIFYAGDSAYSFQYLSLAIKKYEKDEEWMKNNKGFEVKDIARVLLAIGQITQLKLAIFQNEADKEKKHVLDFLIHDINEISRCLNTPKEIVRKIISEFLIDFAPTNLRFKQTTDYNNFEALPIIPVDKDRFLLFGEYNFLEALYERPYQWLISDSSYKHQASKNKGNFTEKFCYEKLCLVFGKENVFRNITIFPKNKNSSPLGEIDILVLYAGRAIIIETKAKGLRSESRRGNDNTLKRDFDKAIQKAYDQTLKNAKYLKNPDVKFILPDQTPLMLPESINEIFPITITSEHYPALFAQWKRLLNFESSLSIKPPMIWDIFFLDVLVEFLDNPLFWISYLDRRAKINDKTYSTSELALLGFHINHNLYLEQEYDFFAIDEGFMHNLNVSFLVRRLGYLGERTPKGILTFYKNTEFGEILDALKKYNNSGAISLGISILEFSAEALKDISTLIRKSKRDVKNNNLQTRDFFTLLENGNTGLICHFNSLPPKARHQHLIKHCKIRKYSTKAKQWFGISIDPLSEKPFEEIVHLKEPWAYSEELEQESKQINARAKAFKTPLEAVAGMNSKKKIGRNEPCICGSGKKYKKCCQNLVRPNPSNSTFAGLANKTNPDT